MHFIGWIKVGFCICSFQKSLFRFGPGLVIYWFGYVDDLEKLHQKRIILIRNKLPSNITQMSIDPNYNGS